MSKGLSKFTWVVGPVAFSFLFLDPESIVISGIPVGVHLKVLLPLHTRLFVILGLFLSAKAVPL